MQRFVSRFVVWPRVPALAAGQFDAIDEFDIRAVIQFIRMAGGRIRDEESKRPSLRLGIRRAVELIDQHRLVRDSSQWNAGREVVPRGVQSQIGRRGFRLNSIQQRPQRHLSLLFGEGFRFGAIVFFAMTGNLMVAGFAGAFIPILLEKFKVDPAIASSIFVTTFTDMCGFFLLLGLAAKYLF